jgi:hypothetical protein
VTIQINHDKLFINIYDEMTYDKCWRVRKSSEKQYIKTPKPKIRKTLHLSLKLKNIKYISQLYYISKKFTDLITHLKLNKKLGKTGPM